MANKRKTTAKGKPKAKAKVATRMVSDDQRRHIFDTAEAAGISNITLREILGSMGFERTEEIPSEGYDLVIARLEEIHRADAGARRSHVEDREIPFLD